MDLITAEKAIKMYEASEAIYIKYLEQNESNLLTAINYGCNFFYLDCNLENKDRLVESYRLRGFIVDGAKVSF